MYWRNNAKLLGWFKLLAASAAIFFIWGTLLPAWGRYSACQQRLHDLERQGIDAGAFFYTDHPLMIEHIGGSSRETFDVQPQSISPAPGYSPGNDHPADRFGLPHFAPGVSPTR